jgi:rhodanese-related sulfurtransferase
MYSLSDDDVISAMASIRKLAERSLAEVNQLIETYLKVKDDLEPIAAEELLERARKGLVTVLDVRPPDEFAAGHLPGAINVPLSELEDRMKSLTRRTEIIAYCRGPYCIMAYEAVHRLRGQGYKARRLQDGFPEWKLGGLPVEKGPTPG